jgi:hypothetical protein
MKYEKDPTIEEIHDVRKEIFLEFKRNPRALGKHLMELDRKRKRNTTKRVRGRALTHS